MVLRSYTCGFCFHKFEQDVSYWNGNMEYGTKGKAGSGSSQVKCPMCQNFLKTWNNKDERED